MVGGGGGAAFASAFSGGGPFGLNGCCAGGFSAAPVSAGYLAAVCRTPAGGVSLSMQAEKENAVSNASGSQNFIIYFDEVYTGSISMPVPLDSQSILQKPIAQRFPILLQQ